MIATALSGLMLVTLAAGALLAVLHSRRWRVGAPAKVDLLGGVLALPRRYLVDVHDVVARKPFTSRFHALTAGGFIAWLPLVALAAAPAFHGWVLWTLLSAALTLMLCGALMSVAPPGPPPAELSQAASAPAIGLAGLCRGLLIVALDQLPVAFYPCRSPLFSSCSAPSAQPNYPRSDAGRSSCSARRDLFVAHPRPARFHDGGGRDVAPSRLTSARKSSASNPRWIRLEQLAGLRGLCPMRPLRTFAPLRRRTAAQPEKTDPGRGRRAGRNRRRCDYAGHHHPGRIPGQAHGGRLLPLIARNAMIHRIPWACTTCRACVEACPMRSNTSMRSSICGSSDAGAWSDARKAASRWRVARHRNPGGGRGSRKDWAADLSLPLIADRANATAALAGDAGVSIFAGKEPARAGPTPAASRLARLLGVDSW